MVACHEVFLGNCRGRLSELPALGVQLFDDAAGSGAASTTSMHVDVQARAQRRAKDLLFHMTLMDMLDEALTLGVATRLVAADALDAAVRALNRRLLATRR